MTTEELQSDLNGLQFTLNQMLADSNQRQEQLNQLNKQIDLQRGAILYVQQKLQATNGDGPQSPT